MFYIQIIVALVAFGSGFYTASLDYTSKLAEYDTLIKVQNKEAADLYNQLQEKAKQDEQRQQEIATELDKANESNLATINSYHDQLSKLRLPKRPSGTSCTSTNAKSDLPKSTEGVQRATEEGQRELPTSPLGFFTQESLRADRMRLGLETCLDFVINSNCGIAK